MRYLITPQILHEGAEQKHSRHNKALTTIAFVPKLGLSYILITGLMAAFSKSRGGYVTIVMVREELIQLSYYSWSNTAAA